MYCTQLNITRHIGEDDLTKLSDYDEDGSPDAAVVTQAIENATGTIDSYLGVKFVVPLVPPIPKEIRRICVMLAVCELQTGRDSMTEDHAKVCENAMTELQKIADGKKTVGLQPLPAEAAGAPTVLYDVQPRAFGRDKSL